MHEGFSQFLKRVVLLLLVARVVAAPIALRPAPADDPTRSVVVVRVCAWLAERVRSGSETLTVGERTTAPGAELPHAGLPLPEMTPLRSTRPFVPADAYDRRSIARLRC